jgi:hypothetical protein
VNDFHCHLAAGASDLKALLANSNQLGRNRAAVTRQGFVSADERGKAANLKMDEALASSRYIVKGELAAARQAAIERLCDYNVPSRIRLGVVRVKTLPRQVPA